MALKKERGSNKTKGICKFAIDEEMTIYAIATLKDDISKEIDSYKTFEFNLSNVEEIDSAGIQLMLAFKRELMKKKKDFKITAVSGSVAKLIEGYGINDLLNLESVA